MNYLDFSYQKKPLTLVLKYFHPLHRISWNDSITFLAWVSTKEVKEYFTNAQRKLDDQKEEDLQRGSWKRHSLYKESKGNLVSKCLQAGLSSFGNKHDLVCQIVENTDTGVSHTSLTENDL